MISYTDLLITDQDGNQSNLDAMMLNLDYSLRNIKLASDGSIAEWDGKFISAPDEEPNWDTPKVAVDWTGFEDRIKTIQNEIHA